jgi:hypothetical protein
MSAIIPETFRLPQHTCSRWRVQEVVVEIFFDFWLSAPLRGVCMCGEAGKSGVARNTACHRTPDAAAETKRIGTPRQPFWSAVASGIPRDTALMRL